MIDILFACRRAKAMDVSDLASAWLHVSGVLRIPSLLESRHFLRGRTPAFWFSAHSLIPDRITAMGFMANKLQSMPST